VKHPIYLFNGVVDGIGSYGNSIGIPTVNGATLFAEEYTGNVVVYAGCIGVLKKDQYLRCAKPGDYCVLAGGNTGLDGIHGVTFASLELTTESEKIYSPEDIEQIKGLIEGLKGRAESSVDLEEKSRFRRSNRAS
jgi:phosphoribosylformylglycinamidine synthase